MPILFRAEMDPVVLDGVAAAVRLAVLGSPTETKELSKEDVEAWAGKLLFYMSKINRFSLTLQLADSSASSCHAIVLTLGLVP